jgi:hypothetical protein
MNRICCIKDNMYGFKKGVEYSYIFEGDINVHVRLDEDMKFFFIRNYTENVPEEMMFDNYFGDKYLERERKLKDILHEEDRKYSFADKDSLRKFFTRKR